jgi:hypothetical protein
MKEKSMADKKKSSEATDRNIRRKISNKFSWEEKIRIVLEGLRVETTMEMVLRYLSIAQAVLDKNHKLASPVDNWRL